MDVTETDPTSLLQGQSTSDAINQALQPLAGIFIILTIFSVLATIAIIVIWILSVIRRRKVQNAIFDIQATLHELNERDKSRTAPQPVVEQAAQPTDPMT